MEAEEGDGQQGGAKRPADDGEQGPAAKRPRTAKAPREELTESQAQVKSAIEKIVEGAEKQLLTAEFVVAFRFNGVDYEFKAPVVKTLSVPDKIALAPCWAGGDQLGVGIMAFAAQLKQAIANAPAPKKNAKKDKKPAGVPEGQAGATPPPPQGGQAEDSAGGDDEEGAAAGAGDAVGVDQPNAAAAGAPKPKKASVATLLKTVSEASQAERVPSGDQAAAAAAAALDANNPPKVVDPLSLTLRCVLTETGRVLAGDVADLEIVLPLEELADAVGACATKRGGGDSEEVRALRAAVTEARDGQASMDEAVKAFKNNTKAQRRQEDKLRKEREKEAELRAEIAKLREELRALRQPAAAAQAAQQGAGTACAMAG